MFNNLFLIGLACVAATVDGFRVIADTAQSGQYQGGWPWVISAVKPDAPHCEATIQGFNRAFGLNPGLECLNDMWVALPSAPECRHVLDKMVATLPALAEHKLACVTNQQIPGRGWYLGVEWAGDSDAELEAAYELRDLLNDQMNRMDIGTVDNGQYDEFHPWVFKADNCSRELTILQRTLGSGLVCHGNFLSAPDKDLCVTLLNSMRDISDAFLAVSCVHPSKARPWFFGSLFTAGTTSEEEANRLSPATYELTALLLQHSVIETATTTTTITTLSTTISTGTTTGTTTMTTTTASASLTDHTTGASATTTGSEPVTVVEVTKTAKNLFNPLLIVLSVVVLSATLIGASYRIYRQRNKSGGQILSMSDEAEPMLPVLNVDVDEGKGRSR